MATPTQRYIHLSIVMSLVLLLTGRSLAAFSPKYCSTINTASTAANYSNFQSNGLCDTFCAGHAYAILQDSACWCSDYTPADSTTVDLNECDEDCPGYPDDKCGAAPDLFIYLFRNRTPAGTKGATTSSSPTPTRTTTVQNTVTISPSFSSTETSSTKNKNTGTLSTITTGDVIQTVTISPDGEVIESKGGLSAGTVAGMAIGIIAAVLGIAGLVFFLWWKKRKDKSASSADPSPRSSSAGMISTMASMSEAGQTGKRGSKFIPIDDRMEFHHGLYVRGADGNPSRESVNSLRDDVDYSRRVLRATNPDPPAHD